MSESIGIGMIGYKFMGKAHSNAYRQVNQFFDLPVRPRLKTICGRDKPKVDKMAQRWGWENAVDDWRRIIDDPEIRIVDICSPNNTHHDIAIAAFEAGKIVACEKPMAMNGAEAERMAAAARKSGQINTVWFNYRRVPAIAFARQLVDEGRIGKVYHFRALYLQDWTMDPNVPLLWRMDKDVAGSGVTGRFAFAHRRYFELPGGRYRVGRGRQPDFRRRAGTARGRQEQNRDRGRVRLRVPLRGRRAGAFRGDALRQRAQERQTRSRSTASTAACTSTWKTCRGCGISIRGSPSTCKGGRRSRCGRKRILT